MSEPGPAVSQEQVMAILQQVLDPELGISVVDLGLIYGIEVRNKQIHVRMTLTTPACPMTQYLVSRVETALREALPDAEVEVELVWDPPWDPSRLSAAARRKLGIKPAS